MQEDMRRTAGAAVKAYSHGIKVQIEESCWKDMFGWCRAAESEVSGFGIADLVDGVFKVSKVYFPEQMCSSGYTRIGFEAYARLKYALMKRKEPHWWNPGFWWHTHYNFGTFWSGTDDDQAQQNAAASGEHGLSLVINQAGNWLARADFIKPVPVMLDELKVELINDSHKHPKRNYRRDIKKWVSPFPVFRKKVAIWKPKGIEVTEIDKGVKYVYAGNRLVTLDEYAVLLACECGTQSCDSCKEVLNGHAIN